MSRLASNVGLVGQFFNPLLGRSVPPIRNWHQWLALWNAADNFPWMESLLHVGYNIPVDRCSSGEPEYDFRDKCMFYLSVADGWCSSVSLKSGEDQDYRYIMGYDSCGNQIQTAPEEIRRRLAGKAFDVLCLNLFKLTLKRMGRHDEEFDSMWEVVTGEKLFPAIQAFFKAEKHRYGSEICVYNLSQPRSNERSHNEQNAVNFLLSLAEYLWCWEREVGERLRDSSVEEHKRRFEKTLPRINAAKPWMIEVLAWLDQLDLLRKQLPYLDKACVDKLKEIALRSELSQYRHPVKKDRVVRTLDEACFVDSKAAWLLKVLENQRGESKRLSAILEQENAVEGARRKLDRLNAGRDSR